MLQPFHIIERNSGYLLKAYKKWNMMFSDIQARYGKVFEEFDEKKE